MGYKKPKMSSPEISYFELQAYVGIQAYVGTTKHLGGFETTKALIELCDINQDTYVLEVGCGVGATACYLAKKYGCRVVGVDLLESMIARSNERARREGMSDLVEFRVADAQGLPFEDALFDVVIGESVLTFIRDKHCAASECARVTRPGGYVGLNEELWIETPPAPLVEQVRHIWDINEELWIETPPAPLVEQVRHIWDIKPAIPALEGWMGLLEGAGLRDIVVQTCKFDVRRESSQIKRYRFQDMWRMFYRTLFLYIKNPAFREYMAERRHLGGISRRIFSNIWDTRYSLDGDRNGH